MELMSSQLIKRVTLKPKFNIQADKRKHMLCVRLLLISFEVRLWGQVMEIMRHLCAQSKEIMLVFVGLLLFLMALMFDGEEVNYFSEEVPNSFFFFFLILFNF